MTNIRECGKIRVSIRKVDITHYEDGRVERELTPASIVGL